MIGCCSHGDTYASGAMDFFGRDRRMFATLCKRIRRNKPVLAVVCLVDQLIDF
jgi:hypothetical protein